MEFVPGKFYRTRGGHKAMYLGRNPFASDHSRCHVFATKEMGIQTNRSDGIYFHEQEHHSDIIGEWQEPVTVTRWWFGAVKEGKEYSYGPYRTKSDSDSARMKVLTLGGCRVSESKEDSVVVP